jgi:Flp pilus assembly protein TadG
MIDTWRRSFVRLEGDGGQVTAFVVVVVTALLGMAGLVIDGGYALSARQEAANVAEQAARIGADQVVPDSLRAGPARLDRQAAHAAALAYLAEVGHSGNADADDTTVTVTVTVTRRTSVLRIVGVDALTVTGEATARGVAGIREIEDEALP